MKFYGLSVEFPEDIAETIFGENWVGCVWRLFSGNFLVPNTDAFLYESLDFWKKFFVFKYI